MAIESGTPSRWLELLGAVGSSQLPGDMMMEILIRLPVKSILRFKSVCRAWNLLFVNPVFIKHHYQMAISSSSGANTSHFLVHTRDNNEFNHIVSLLLEPPYDQPILKNISPPFEGAFDCLTVVDSINGVVCLNLSTDAAKIVLWNPAVRTHFQIPNPKLLLRTDERVSLGFGYDSKSDSFKVVRVLYSKHFAAKLAPARIEVYSTKTGDWRSKEVVNLPWLCYQKTCSIVVRGSPYWYAVQLQEHGMVFRELVTWFDAESEEFTSHALPSYHNLSAFRLRLGVIKENLAVVVYSIDKEPDGMVEIWLLSSDGGGRNATMSWVKKFSVSPILGVKRVIGCGKSCEIIAEDEDGALIIYDPSPRQIKDLPHYRSWGYTEIYGHIDSLVALSSQDDA